MIASQQAPQDPVAEVLRLLFATPGDAYAILDAARAGRVLRLLRSTNLEHLILYEGAIDPLIAEVAPYLVALPKGSPDARRIVEAAWGNAWGVFCASRKDLQSLRRHLRIFLTVLTESKKKMLFRFYDPRVLRPFLPSCTQEELTTFFGPIDQFVFEGEEPRSAHVHERKGNAFTARAVPLRTEA